MHFKFAVALNTLMFCAWVTTELLLVDAKEIDNEMTTGPLIVRSVDKDKGLPKETQMAQCTVTSGDIKASAQATFSKKLEGFCSTNDMKDLRIQLNSLESRLHDELYNLKMMIQNMMSQNFNYQPPIQQQHQYQNYMHDGRNRFLFQPQPAQNTMSQQRVNETPISSTERNIPIRNQSVLSSTTPATSYIFTTTNRRPPEVVSVMKNKLKSLDKNRKLTPVASTTTTSAPTTTSEKPVEQLVPSRNEYTYFWKLDNFPRAFRMAKKNEIFSHVFNVKGLFLRIRAALYLHEDEDLIFDLEHLANVDNNEKMEVEISDGFVFKEIATENLFQYNFAIMDQRKPDHDLISPIYCNTDSDTYLIPNSVHLLANYIKNDSILIKVNIIF